MKKSFKKFKPGIVSYRSHKNFSNESFRECLLEKISKKKLTNNDDGYKGFATEIYLSMFEVIKYL